MRKVALAFLTAAALSSAGCDELGLGPRTAEPAPVVAPAAPAPDLSVFVGRTYADLGIALPAYTPEAQHLTAPEAARLSTAMAVQSPAWVISGGGAEVLVFTGCAAEGCAAGRAIVAVDMATGEAFVATRDSAGATEFAPSARVEALLSLSAPSRRWEDIAPPTGAQAAPR